jgi:hypothetical protein
VKNIPMIILAFVLVACATTKEHPPAPMPAEYHLAVYIPGTAELHSEAHEEYLDAVLDVEKQAKRFDVHLAKDTHVFALVQKKLPNGSRQ